MLSLDIFKIIFNNLDFKSQMNMISSRNYFRNHLFITDLYNIERKYLDNLTTEILKYSIFSHVIELNVGNNNKITNVSFMTSLKKLNAWVNCEIGQKSIIGLNKFKLVAGYNNKITNVSFMASLKILNAWGDCGIGQNGIIGLNLVELDVGGNNKITNVSFMTSLKKLDAGGDGGIDQNGIIGLNLVQLVEKKLKQCFNFF